MKKIILAHAIVFVVLFAIDRLVIWQAKEIYGIVFASPNIFVSIGATVACLILAILVTKAKTKSDQLAASGISYLAVKYAKNPLDSFFFFNTKYKLSIVTTLLFVPVLLSTGLVFSLISNIPLAPSYMIAVHYILVSAMWFLPINFLFEADIQLRSTSTDSND